MLFNIRHVTTVAYSAPVVLEPTTIRLRPRVERTQSLQDFSMRIDPSPAGCSEATDVEGNDVALAWFLGKTEQLAITTTATVRTHRTNPFDFVVLDPERARIPPAYTGEERRALERFLESEPDRRVGDWARPTVRAAGEDATRLPVLLVARIAEELDSEVRLEGGPHRPAETLRRSSGSCRDLTVLFMAACRGAGLASRFVSGYHQGDPDEEEKHLHAWAEVFLPGVGWRGFDPSLGLAVADAHVSVATGPSPESAAPTEGTFRGSARSVLTSRLEIATRPG